MTAIGRRSRIRRLEAAVHDTPAAVRRSDGPQRRTAVVGMSMAFDTGEPVPMFCDRPRPAFVPPEATRSRAADDGGGWLPDASTEELGTEEVSAHPQGDVSGTVSLLGAGGQGGQGPDAVDLPADGGTEATGGSESSGDDLTGWRMSSAIDDGDEAFAQDIAAILAHTKSVAGTSGRQPLPAPASTPPAPPPPSVAPQGPPPGIGGQPGHDVFDRMAAANTPQRYDQGPVTLAVDFGRLDRALDRPGSDLAPEDAVSVNGGAAVAPGTPAPPPETVPVGDAPGAGSPGTITVEDVAAIADKARAFRVTTDVPLLPQGPGLTCHAAACAALVAWRDDVPPDPAEVAAGSGYWERFAGGRSATFPAVLDTFGLSVTSAGTAPSPHEVRDLIDGHGPLWAAASPPAEHAVVLAGITGDGTGTGTLVDVVDPWAQGMTTFAVPNPGSRYSISYTDLVRGLGGPDGRLTLAHLKGAAR